MVNDKKILAYAQLIEGLHSTWTPHPGQIRVGKPFLKEDLKDLMIVAGRNWGKTDFLAYMYWRYARSNPGTENYYFAPYMKQAREILWASKRIQNFGPRDWITENGINNTEMRITFSNGSFIKLDGSDNVDSYRGVKPKGLIGYDEYKDFRPDFHSAFDPNRAAHNCPLIIIGTLPDQENHFIKTMQEFKNNPEKRLFIAPTRENPHIPKEWLKKKKAELESKGEHDVWLREYECVFVKGGASKIFPMVSWDYYRNADELANTLRRDIKKLEWFVIADPAAATCFAVLFLALNPFTKKVYVVDEIYQTDQGKMSVAQIRNVIEHKCNKHNQRKPWRKIYDEAETWFANEMMQQFGEFWEPSQKALNDKDSGLSLMKDTFLANKLEISTDCPNFFYELDNYYKDKNGKIPKKDDHLIDCYRYFQGASYYHLNTEAEPLNKELQENAPRAYRISDDFQNLDDMGRINSDWEDYG